MRINNIKIIYAFIAAVLVQVPLGYLFVSLEGLVLGNGLIGFPDGIGIFFFATIFIASLVILLLGLPSYFALKRFNIVNTLNVVGIGFLIPFVIISLVSLLPSYEGFSAGENYYGTYREMFINGQRTNWGWVKFLEDITTFAIHGIVGAMLFHKIYSKTNTHNKALNKDATSVAPIS